jgi:hypothetical protein
MNAFIASPIYQAAQAGCGYAWLNGLHSSRLGFGPKALDDISSPGEDHV